MAKKRVSPWMKLKQLKADLASTKLKLEQIEVSSQKYRQYCSEFLQILSECAKENKTPNVQYWIKRSEILWR